MERSSTLFNGARLRASVWSLSALVGALAACAGAQAVVTRDLVEQDARAVSEVFSDFVTRNLPPSSLDDDAAHDRAIYAGIMGTIAGNGRVLHVSLYDRHGTVVWSDEASRIGANFAQEAQFRDAVAGVTQSRIIYAPIDKSADRHPARMHMILFPIRYAADAPVTGVIEVDRDAPRLFAVIDRTSRIVWVLGGGSVLASLVLFGFMSSRGKWRERWDETLADLPSPANAYRRVPRATLRRMNDVREAEARRIAHALHDEAGQLLAAVHIALMEWWQELPPDSMDRMRRITGLLDNIELRLRDLSHELRPTILDDLGIGPALEFLAEQVTKRTGIRVTVEGSSGGRLSSAIETTLYRVAQESLTNVVRHARAMCVKIRLEHDRRTVRCAITDDGVGFDVPAVLSRKGEHGLGLLAMRERLASLQGTVKIESAPGRGTRLLVAIPMENPACLRA
jgi:signal transduction histidine kinase